MLIMKFGGTSVSAKTSVETICQLVTQTITQQPVVVVSALSKVTDTLVSLCNVDNFANVDIILEDIYCRHYNLGAEFLNSNALQIVAEFVRSNLAALKQQLATHYASGAKVTGLSLKDEVVFYGEKMSSFLIASIITQYTKIKAQQVLSSTCIVTNRKFGSADYIATPTRKKTKQVLLPLIKQGIVPVVTGFVGATHAGEITTLGRGGSDYSASIIGYALNADEIQIWTDVDGVYTTDPRLVKSAKLLPLLAYDEASELANLGAKILHPRTIKPAILAKIPVRVLNTFNPKCLGTTIIEQTDEIKRSVKAITIKKAVPLIILSSNEMLFGKGFLNKLFRIFARYDISVNLLSVSEVSISITLDNAENLDRALKHIAKLGIVVHEGGYGSISLVGTHIMDTPHLMKDIFTILDQAKIEVHMLSYSASNINVSMLLLSKDIEYALGLLHAHFIS